MLRKNAIQIYQRGYCTKKINRSNNNYSADLIRKSFIEYFTNIHEHQFVRSSPVVPLSDPTVAFVNAGMNQFKSIFLGKTNPPATRVVNSQKCIRVGGKHNDLSIVGQDGYHHTFFEMLGNWSFGDYYKKEACSMALDYLRGPLGVDENSLYVTYFAGDDKLNLPPDLECYDIWKSLGIKTDRILPFGSKDNFWEMGAVGPCGPCTEIHIDHISGGQNRSKLVNKGRSDLTELWNIVFIEHNRNTDGTITPLPQKHVDTGMGLERLCAIMQKKTSNYDTDLFTPIFDNIYKITKLCEYGGKFASNNENHELDTAYRIMADHSRMITACLSDSMLPDQNQKLRRIMRKCFLLAENTFNKDNLLTKLVPVVANILGEVYPEMSQKLSSSIEIVNYEQELFKMLRENSAKVFREYKSSNVNFDDLDIIECPGFLPAYKELQQEKKKFANGTIPWQFLYKLNDTYGLNEEYVKKLCEIENLKINLDELKTQVKIVKDKAKKCQLGSMEPDVNSAVLEKTISCSDTDDSYKYTFAFNTSTQRYENTSIQAKVIGILQNSKPIPETTVKLTTNTDDIFCIIMDKTNFYYESGGQESDTGVIKFLSDDGEEVRFHVNDVQYINGNTVHRGRFAEPNKIITTFGSVELLVNYQRRSQNCYNHTATHLLNGAIRCLFNKVTYQISSSVTRDRLKLDLGIIGKKLSRDDVDQIDQYIRRIIDAECPVNLIETNAASVLNTDVTLVPGEIYPETGLRLITIENPKLKFTSKELCCGTHVQNTSHIKNFCVTNFRQLNRASYAFTAVSEDVAEKAIELAKIYALGIDKLETELQLEQDKHLQVESELQKLRHSLMHGEILLPYVFKMNLIDRVDGMLQMLKESARTTLKEFVEIEMKTVLEQNSQNSFIIHFLDSANLVKSVHLQKATKLCQDRPIIVISLTNGMVKARCCVPSKNIKDNFNATSWLNVFASIFGGSISAPKGQNSDEVCNMKAKKIIAPVFEDQLEEAINNANKFANERM